MVSLSRSRRVGRTSVAAVLSIVIVLVVTACLPAPGTWVTREPQPVGSGSIAPAEVRSVSCITPQNCIASGTITAGWGVGGSTTPTPTTLSTDGVDDISCEVTGCWAIRRNLDGTSGAILRSDNGSSLYFDQEIPFAPRAIDCPGPRACLLVGQGTNGPIAWLLDTIGWRPLPLSIAISPTSVACGAPNSCVVAGLLPVGQGEPSAIGLLAWDGSGFAENGEVISGFSPIVGCSGAGHCVMVAHGAGPVGVIARTWDGASWQTAPGLEITGPAQPDALDCAALPNPGCVMLTNNDDGSGVHSYRDLGSGWQALDGPGALSFQPTDVVCNTPSDCLAVGQLGYGTYASFTRLIDDSWSPVTPFDGVRRPDSELADVECVAADACIAVGSSVSGLELDGLAQRWDGTAWTVLPSPRRSLGLGELRLTGVSCTAVDDCHVVAVVGSLLPAPGMGQAFLHWNGTAWSVDAVAPGVDLSSPYLGPAAISCTGPAACMAGVGSRLVRWDGHTWAGSPMPAEVQGLTGLDCASDTWCLATITSGPPFAAGGLQWNGTIWSLTPPLPAIDGAVTVPGSGVSCPVVGTCFVARFGVVGPSPYREVTQVVRWSGSAWAVAAPSGPYSPGLSCSTADHCLAVGGGTNIELNGTTWSPPKQAPSFNFPVALSCAGPACMAVGAEPIGLGSRQPAAAQFAFSASP